ncbi:hypothetical protein [Nitrosospira sp. NpAV]|uniref:hypothetical protein n=1 Tax=Nitrosospira sp. NpAV TaxID=58133 RepID=UPI00059F6F7E|nr:hypothetical protein [Nitrosospira sp. NpAV]KIO48369.1 hypothetical protein SQ11_11445 [Nitrosospira sp. NpAV]
MDNDLFLFPITGWEIKTVPVDGVLSVRFPFLSHDRQKLSDADPGRPYVMHADQARELRDALSRAITQIENQKFEPAESTALPTGLLIY